MSKYFLVLIFLVVVATPLLSASAEETSMLSIENVHVLPMDGDRILRDHAVVVENGRIRAVVPMADHVPPEFARRVDGQGGYLMPGLVDAHVHIEEYMGARPEFGDAPVFLRHGITAVFNLRGFPEHLSLRDRIAAGELLAPTLYTAGEFVNEPRVNTPEEADAEVRAQAAAGYDLIKFREVVDHEVGVLTTHGVDLDTFRAVHKTANRLGIPVLGHAPHGLGLEPVLEAGHTLAHVGELGGLYFFPPYIPYQRSLYHWALSVLAALTLLALAIGLVTNRQSGSASLPRLAGLALFLAMIGYLLPLALLPGGWRYGDLLLIVVLALVLLGLLTTTMVALRHALRRGQAWWTRLLFGLAGAATLTAGMLGLVQDLPTTLRATPAGMERVAKNLADSGARVVTTLVLYDELSALRRTGASTRLEPQAPEQVDAAYGLDPEYRNDYLRAREILARRDWRSLSSFDGLLMRYDDFTRELTGALHSAGVSLLAGTDAFGVGLIPPGRSLHAELAILVEAGLSPYEALHTATVAPARFLGLETEFGQIVAGQRADLILLADDPLTNISAVTEPQAVMLRGQWLSRAEIESMIGELVAAQRPAVPRLLHQ